MLRASLAELVRAAVALLVSWGSLPESALGIEIEIQDTKQPEHGDFACNFAMVAAKACGMAPRAIAELLQEALGSDAASPIQGVEVAGPGFLNLRLKPEVLGGLVPKIVELGETLPRAARAAPGKRVNVEFVSVNPNGPITVGSGRGAAFGDTLCRVLDAAGLEPYREYYVNDGVNSEQMRLFAESVAAHAQGKPLPESGYRGEYVERIAHSITEADPSAASRDLEWIRAESQRLMIERQAADLTLFGVRFDRWFSEQSLVDEAKVESTVAKLLARGDAYRAERSEAEEEGAEEDVETAGMAVWMRSAKYGDDKDRVLQRADGRYTYIASDIAYLESKLGERGFERAYMILGPDHHGYIGRMHAAYQALGYPMRGDTPERLEIVIFQIVRFMKDGKPAPMRKRDGNIYELQDLIMELGASVEPNAEESERIRVGRDVARFFYLMRSHETHMDFDIDLATKQSDENPVFYVQYAHARICSVIKKAAEAGLKALPELCPTKLRDPREMALAKKIVDLPHEVRRCAEDYGVHRLTTYAVDLARTYHHFYDSCRVIQPDQPELSGARLALCEAARIGLRATFDLLGISAPERMDREAVP